MSMLCPLFALLYMIILLSRPMQLEEDEREIRRIQNILVEKILLAQLSKNPHMASVQALQPLVSQPSASVAGDTAAAAAASLPTENYEESLSAETVSVETGTKPNHVANSAATPSPVAPEEPSPLSRTPQCAWFKKQGQINSAFKRRYFVLNGLSVDYYAKVAADGTPNSFKGSIKLSAETRVESRGTDLIIVGDRPLPNKQKKSHSKRRASKNLGGVKGYDG